MHHDLGVYAAEKGIDLLACCGPLSAKTAAAAGAYGAKAVWYPTAEELIAALPALLQKGDRVLVKASLGMHMERAAEAVKKLESSE